MLPREAGLFFSDRTIENRYRPSLGTQTNPKGFGEQPSPFVLESLSADWVEKGRKDSLRIVFRDPDIDIRILVDAHARGSNLLSLITISNVRLSSSALYGLTTTPLKPYFL